MPSRGWQPHSAGDGAKGPRLYDWAWIGIDPDTGDAPPGHRWLLIRRHRSSGELAYYRCYAPGPVPLSVLVAVAGRRWSIEENFQTGKGLCGMDQHQVRRWRSWRRWTILAMLAHAFLSVLAAAERKATDTRQLTDLIPLTRNEIRHLLAVLVVSPARNLRHRLAWSTWRRRHQHRARTSHYQRRSHLTP